MLTHENHAKEIIFNLLLPKARLSKHAQYATSKKKLYLRVASAGKHKCGLESGKKMCLIDVPLMLMSGGERG